MVCPRMLCEAGVFSGDAWTRWQRCAVVSRTVTFPDRRFPDKTFPGQTIPGQDVFEAPSDNPRNRWQITAYHGATEAISSTRSGLIKPPPARSASGGLTRLRCFQFVCLFIWWSVAWNACCSWPQRRAVYVPDVGYAAQWKNFTLGKIYDIAERAPTNAPDLFTQGKRQHGA